MKESWLDMQKMWQEWGSIPIIKIKKLSPKHVFLLKSDGLTHIHTGAGLQMKALSSQSPQAVTWERCGPFYGREETFSHCSKKTFSGSRQTVPWP